MNAPLAVEIRGLAKVYGTGHTSVAALTDVDLEVRKGSVAALLGPSGAGKSTLLTAIGLINPPTKGQVFINGDLIMDGPEPKADLRAFRRRNIGFVFQKANLIPFLTAAENVQLAMEINDVSSREAKDRAIELLEYLDVGNRAGNLPSMLSGGEQQRVAVARALANRPSLILADEPTAALDSVRGRKVMELFARIAHEQGAGVIVVTHDHRALDVFDEIHEMEDGRLKKASKKQGFR